MLCDFQITSVTILNSAWCVVFRWCCRLHPKCLSLSLFFSLSLSSLIHLSLSTLLSLSSLSRFLFYLSFAFHFLSTLLSLTLSLSLSLSLSFSLSLYREQRLTEREMWKYEQIGLVGWLVWWLVLRYVARLFDAEFIRRTDFVWIDRYRERERERWGGERETLRDERERERESRADWDR